MGNLVTVTEPDPTSGTVTTSYTYNATNQLLSVSMPRSSGTQTRSFVWTGGDMTSATNPENGTVTYTYDGAHRVKTRIDAKGQKTQYTYDLYGRRSMIQYFNSSQVEQISQRVTYGFDSGQNGLGRLSSVTFSNETSGAPEQFSYLYDYTPSGRVARQRMHLGTGSTGVDLDATYEWDNEGKMTSTVPPGGGIGGGTPNKYLYYYDSMGRLNGMTETSCLTQTVTQAAPVSPCTTMGSTVATAAYGPTGQMSGLTYDGYSEARTYNSLMQLTRMTTTGSGQTAMDMTYTFSGTQNNGQITQSTDGTISGGETVAYTYDTLNRLAKAETISTAWGEAYTYDGFGNLTAKTPTKGTPPTMSAAYDAATNHQVGQTYDANGNTGYSAAYPYDVENRLLQPLAAGTSPQWSYSPSGKRVFAKTPGNGTTVATTCEIYFYGMSGQKLTTYQCGYNDQTGGNGQFWYQVKSRNLYFGGKLMRSAGVTVVTDRLGSVRANSSGEHMSYYPYGEERTSTADGREKFATYFRDAGGVDYSETRYYSSTNGRFLTPESYTSDPKNPASLNQYSYVKGDPINFNNPHGGELSESCDDLAADGRFLDAWEQGCVLDLAPTGGGGSGGCEGCVAPDPPPDPAPLTCDYKGFKFLGPTTSVTSTSGVNNGLAADGIFLQFQFGFEAAGGDPGYSWNALQTGTAIGSVVTTTSSAPINKVIAETLGAVGGTDGLGPQYVTGDAPGLAQTNPFTGSTLLSATVVWAFHLNVTVQDHGGNFVPCSSVDWGVLEQWITTKDGNTGGNYGWWVNP